MQLFREWDTDGDGTVSRKEFRRGVAALQLVASKLEVNALFSEYDLDQSGKLDMGGLQALLENEAIRMNPMATQNRADFRMTREEAEAEGEHIDHEQVRPGAPDSPVPYLQQTTEVMTISTLCRQ